MAVDGWGGGMHQVNQVWQGGSQDVQKCHRLMASSNAEVALVYDTVV